MARVSFDRELAAALPFGDMKLDADVIALHADRFSESSIGRPLATLNLDHCARPDNRHRGPRPSACATVPISSVRGRAATAFGDDACL